MAPSRNNIITVILIFSLIFLPSKSDLVVQSKYLSTSEIVQQMKMVLGSRPPACVNKCMNCRPCLATLVIPPHQKKGFRESSHGEEDNYYLLSWKCKCGEKFYKP
ncbi:EPIDERMAL PATTERNING FACTOR-like protein 8 [Cornus florida]|uniref:EPIDERMAL PATTERNING FACTOR-like protein 8 n=1 Tax=Cornus florida TaxID=4283 RepID=UPI0028A07FF7|nr:EPIDERMAL PATTERNING FACTOR-like protein 8 [Cornus florida]